MNWIKGNIPKEDGYYWITINSMTKTITYPIPCKYSSKEGCWIDSEGKKISIHTVVAYYPISMPKAYSTIGSGSGYYIRTICKNDEIIYGFGLQPANWVMRGYRTPDNAKAALKRLHKLDLEENYERDIYEILDGNGEFVWRLGK